MAGDLPNGASTTAKPTTSGKSRGQLKRLKAKNKTKSTATADPVVVEDERPPVLEIKEEEDDVKPTVDDSKPDLIPAGFEEVFSKFQLKTEEDDEDSKPSTTIDGKGEIIYSDDELPSEDDEDALAAAEAAVELSARRQRKLARLSVAELKRLVKKPEVVEWVDVSATDPKLLVQIKSYRNTIPVPGHWSQKRDYLQGKRGIEKAQFQLPSFIADTGIATQRDAIKEKEEGQGLKAKTRERVQPKMGKIDIDYQKLHDAFFKYQTKPKLTEFGELYYEGKEYETNLKEKKPGELSAELTEALSIPPLAPPPWLISMQRYGPPPSYPNLRIAGLNAPIPEGAAWGFHPGGWGRPPLDEFGRPLYGDIYGVTGGEGAELGEAVVKDVWGELEPDEEDSDDEEESDEDSDDEDTPAGGLQTPSGLDTPSGLSSVTSTVPGGLETPDFLDLRKRREATSDGAVVDEGGPKNLYTVIPEREMKARGFMGGDRGYDVSGITQSQPLPVLGREERGTKRKAGGVEIALDAAELEGLSDAELRAKYDAGRRNPGNQHEDLSNEVSEEMSKRRKTAEAKKKGASGGGGGGGKEKEKETFKF